MMNPDSASCVKLSEEPEVCQVGEGALVLAERATAGEATNEGSHPEKGAQDTEGSGAEGASLVDLTYWNAWWRVAKVGVPYGVGQSFLILGNYGSVVILSQIGKEELAANTLIGTAENIVMCLSGVLLSTGVVAGRRSELRPSEVGLVYQNSLLIGAMMTLPVCGTLLSVAPLVSKLGYSSSLASIGNEFFQVYATLVPGFLALVSSEQVLLATEHAYVVPLTSLLKVGLNLSLGYVLAFGKAGFPKWGVRGVAFGLVVGNYTALGVTLLFLKLKKTAASFDLFRWQVTRENFREIQKELWLLGVPMSLSILTGAVSSLAVSVLTSDLGDDALAAQEIAFQGTSFTVIPILGFLEGLSIVAGQALEVQHFEAIKKYIISTMAMMATYGTFVLLLMAAVPQIFIQPFLKTSHHTQEQDDYTEIIVLTKKLLACLGLGWTPVGLRLTFTNALYPFGDTQTGMLVDVVIALAFSVGLGYVLGFSAGLGVLGFFVARNIGELFGATVMGFRLGYVFTGARSGNPRKELIELCCPAEQDENEKTPEISPSAGQERPPLEDPSNAGGSQQSWWRRLWGWCGTFFRSKMSHIPKLEWTIHDEPVYSELGEQELGEQEFGAGGGPPSPRLESPEWGASDPVRELQGSLECIDLSPQRQNTI